MKYTQDIIKYLTEDSELRTLLLDIAKCYETNDAKLIKSIEKFEVLQESDYEKVLYIDFSNTNLTEIPKNVEKCGNLLAFDLSQTNINDLDFILQFQNIEILFLDGNISEEIPKEIFQLKELRLLSILNANILTISPDIKKLAKLECIDFSNYWKLEEDYYFMVDLGILPDEIYELKSLSYISLTSNNLGILSNKINQLQNLRYLDLSDNKFTKIPETLQELNNLTYLNINHNQINEKPFFLKNIEKFIANDNYENFYFTNNPFVDNDLGELLRIVDEPELLSYHKILKLLKPQFLIKPQETTKPNENYFTLTLHKSFQTALIQYLYSFKEYVEIAKDKQFDFHIKQQQTELILITNGKNEVKPEELEAYFKEYVAFALQKSEDRTIKDETKHKLSKLDGDILFLKIDQSVDSLRNALEVVKLDLNHAKKDNETLAIVNESLKNENLIYKDEVSFLRTLSLKQADSKEIAIKIANPQQIVTDLDQLLLDLMDKLVSMAERKYTIKIEDLHNDNLIDFLRDKGYIASDQSRSGKAKITAGEIDIMIRKANGTPISIIEAFRLSSAGNKNMVISSHISKLLNDYDTIGHERNFIIVYAEANDFETLCENYEVYMSEINGKDTFQATYPLISFKNTHISNKTDLKVYLAKHRRNGSFVEVHHLVVNFAV